MKPETNVVFAEIRQIKEDEGFEPKMYVDTEGYLTIGYGTCLGYIGDAEFKPMYAITEPNAVALLRTSLFDTYMELEGRLDWLKDQPLSVKCILLNMAYNLGVPNLMGFKNTLRYIENHEYQGAADEMLASSDGKGKSKWYRQVGARAERLSTRMGLINP